MIELAKTPCTKHFLLVDAFRMRKLIDGINAFLKVSKIYNSD